MMSSYISRCATFYPLILHQYKLCIGCRCSVFSWFLLALKSDIKHSTVSVYLISNPEENYLSNCQLEWCSTVGSVIMFVSAFVSVSHCFSLMCETCSLWSALCFFFFWVTVLLFDSSGLLEGIRRNSSPSYLCWVIQPISLPPLQLYFSLELIRTGSHFLSLLS